MVRTHSVEAAPGAVDRRPCIKTILMIARRIRTGAREKWKISEFLGLDSGDIRTRETYISFFFKDK